MLCHLNLGDKRGEASKREVRAGGAQISHTILWYCYSAALLGLALVRPGGRDQGAGSLLLLAGRLHALCCSQPLGPQLLQDLGTILRGHPAKDIGG
ncbi:hypothetical protein F751_1717 [Auxenochlorella protothecoides]|uniref:Uncharacterized protein n=1 Tax=Auxenochlorella protothecoides TaxID=3075 RepID=A0A087SGI4_AUXPR|nr:hypothetical protein F751_1717 [Auxenochlorella protothecoides]KFM24838.1 hypothetical protein F751_1717 [Auxenochlorella protothecoides]